MTITDRSARRSSALENLHKSSVSSAEKMISLLLHLCYLSSVHAIIADKHSGTIESKTRRMLSARAFSHSCLHSLPFAFPCILHFWYLLCDTDCNLLTSPRRDFENGRSACQCNIPLTLFYLVNVRTIRRVGTRHNVTMLGHYLATFRSFSHLERQGV